MTHSIRFCSALMLASASALAQDVTGLKISHDVLPVGEEIRVEVALSGMSAQARCGLRIDFGDRDSMELRVGADGYLASPVIVTRRLNTLGPTTIRVNGLFLPRGLNSVSACGGREVSANVQVVLPSQAQAAATANTRAAPTPPSSQDTKASQAPRYESQPRQVRDSFESAGVFGDSKLPPCPVSGIKNNCYGTQTLHGARYVGDFIEDMRQGYGTLTLPNGDSYTGYFTNNRFDGLGTYTWTDGRRHVGEFQDHKFSGQGIRYSRDGKILESGRYKDDKLISIFNIESDRFPFDPTKSINDRREASRQALRRATADAFGQSILAPCPRTAQPLQWTDCFGTLYGTDAIYVGEFRAGLYHGRGALSYLDGSGYTGEWQRGLRNGQGARHSSDGTVLESGLWKDGILVAANVTTPPAPVRIAPPSVSTVPSNPAPDLNKTSGAIDAPRRATVNVSSCAPKPDDYPILASMVEATGTTRIQFSVDYKGELTNSEIVSSSGNTYYHGLLDRVAVDKLGKCAFKDDVFRAGVSNDGRPIGGTFVVDFVWKLEGISGVQRAVRFIDGTVYDGQWKNGEPHGLGRFYARDGSLFAGNFLYGIHNGEGVEYNPKGVLIRSGTWKAGVYVSPNIANPERFRYIPVSNISTYAATELPSDILAANKEDSSIPSIENPGQCAPSNEDYPPAALRAEAQGTTRIRFTIDSASKLTKAEIVSSAGYSREHRLLDRVAQQKLSECRFRAGTSAGQTPVGGTFLVGFVWRLPPASVGFSGQLASVPIRRPSDQKTEVVVGPSAAIPAAPATVSPPTIDQVNAQNDKLAAELALAKKKQQELEERLANESKERDRLINEARERERPQVALRPERRVALIVGNAAYKISPLDNPVNDATDIDAGLRRAGFQTTLLRNATLAQMREATRRFADQLPTADVALIYFAGHGIESRGRNYMVPVNADLKFEYELADQAYDASSWLEMLEGIRSANVDRVNIVILDACRNNSLIGSRSLSRGLGRLDAPSGTFLAYSTAPGKVAADGPRGQRNSPFTKHLLQAMQQPNLPIEEVFKEVRRNVSRETSGAQVPWESTSLTGFFAFQRGQ